jgi:phosphoglycolate phosphatase-like HAD superfamily hydrolase
VLRELLGEESVEAYARFLHLYRREHRRCPAPFAGMPELLGELAAGGVRLAVVTGKGADAAAITLERIGLQETFDVVEAGSAGGAVKAECMRRVLALWDASPERVFSVGDFPYDVRAAREVGVTPIGAAWASTADRAALLEAGAEEVFDRVAELAAWLRGGRRM